MTTHDFNLLFCECVFPVTSQQSPASSHQSPALPACPWVALKGEIRNLPAVRETTARSVPELQEPSRPIFGNLPKRVPVPCLAPSHRHQWGLSNKTCSRLFLARQAHSGTSMRSCWKPGGATSYRHATKCLPCLPCLLCLAVTSQRSPAGGRLSPALPACPCMCVCVCDAGARYSK